MGTLKPLLPYGNATVLQAVLRSLKACPLSEIIAVLGHRATEIEPIVRAEGVRWVVNADHPHGMLSSIRVGIRAADPAADGYLIALGDQPTIRVETVVALIDAARATGQPVIAVPSVGGRRGHPLLIDAAFRDEILALPDEGGLRMLMQRHPEQVRHVVVDDAGALVDLDTPEDYRQAIARLGE